MTWTRTKKDSWKAVSGDHRFRIFQTSYTIFDLWHNGDYVTSTSTLARAKQEARIIALV